MTANYEFQGVDELQHDYQLSRDNEFVVAACVVIDGATALAAAEGTGLTAAMFLSDAYRRIYEIAQDLRDKGKPVDRYTLASCGIDAHLIEQMTYEGKGTARQVKAYAEEVAADYNRRQTRNLLAELQFGGADADTALTQLTALSDKLHAGTHSGGLVLSPMELTAVFRDYQKRAEDGRAAITSGYPEIDRILSGGQARGGFLRGGMYLFAGRPGEGKTSVALAIADEIACSTNEGAVLYCSLEITQAQVWAKRIARQTGIASNTLLYSPDALTDAQRRNRDTAIIALQSTPFYMTNGGPDMRMTVDEVVAAARSVRDLSVVVVDHIGLLRGNEDNKGNMVAELSEISRKLKQLALKLDIVVIALSQFNRESTKNGGTPTMFDLRGSASLEQDSDAVVIVRRQDYGTADEDGGKVQRVELIAEKNRNGKAGASCLLDIELPTNRLTERQRRKLSDLEIYG